VVYFLCALASLDVLLKMKTQPSIANGFLKRKSFVFALFLVFGLMIFLPDLVQAQAVPSSPSSGGKTGVIDTIKSISDGTLIGNTIKKLLYGLLYLLSLLANLAAIGFVWVLRPEVFFSIMNDPTLYEVWQMVRDFLNLFFILILLFSAFATIFQVDKFSYKKVLGALILTALLVNFSWPISRFVVDVANSAMYFFVDNLGANRGGAQGISMEILKSSQFQHVFMPKLGENPSDSALADTTWTHLFISLIAMFLFAISFLVLTVLMLLRLVALPILVMFSPIGFVGGMIPGLGSYANKWWGSIMKQAFFGPVAVFMLIVAVKFMASVKVLKSGAGQAAANLTASGANADLLAGLLFFSIPIILLWFVITQSQKAATELSGMSITFGTRLAKWTGGLLLAGAGFASGYKFARNTYKSWDQSREQARKDRRDRFWANQLGRKISRGQDALLAKRGPTEGVRGDARGRMYSEDLKKVKETAEKKRFEDMSGKELQDLLLNPSQKNKHAQAAAALELANRGLATNTQLNDIRQLFGEDNPVVRQMESKMKSYDPVAVFRNMQGQMTDMGRERMRSFVESNQFDPKKLSSESLKDKDLMRIMFEAKAISGKELEELRGKGDDYAKAIKDSLNGIAGSFTDMGNEVHRNVQKAFLVQHGKFSDEIANNSEAKKRIIEMSDKETFKRVDKTFVQNNKVELSAGIDMKNYLDIIRNMKGEAAVELNSYVKDLQSTAAAGTNERRLADYAHRNEYLRNL
jgi:hypothetical protein